ncbi:hypothetical protein DEO72_LG2g3092 [Vigna unguiculata]|uniref:Uncharacterized protein n=1 Tax=Vigna unguiculata TaxID=3917 RepID=A0A4D6L2L7_VIGUN|nr:hypothetical protein DEO72_LG2g3092 [Vigna unguiculata]
MFAWWWRDAGTLAERQREGPLSQQRGRRRDDTAAGGWHGFLAGSRGERTRDSGGWRGFLAGSRGERTRDSDGSRARVLAWFSRRGGSGGGAKWRRSSARWWPELQREMEERNCRESCAHEEERGCCYEP